MSQRTRINNMNFGGLLQIRADKLFSRELLKYLYDRLDPETMVLVLGMDGASGWHGYGAAYPRLIR
jgi:hypothetical protein